MRVKNGKSPTSPPPPHDPPLVGPITARSPGVFPKN